MLISKVRWGASSCNQCDLSLSVAAHLRKHMQKQQSSFGSFGMPLSETQCA